MIRFGIYENSGNVVSLIAQASLFIRVVIYKELFRPITENAELYTLIVCSKYLSLQGFIQFYFILVLCVNMSPVGSQGNNKMMGINIVNFNKSKND